jgi:hypothetical protein
MIRMTRRARRQQMKIAIDHGHVPSVHVESRREGAVAFDATLGMHRREFSRREPAEITARGRYGAYAFADLRPRGGAEAQRRARPSPSGGRVIARSIVFALLRRIECGQLTVVEDGHRTVFGMRIVDLEDITPHYAETLRRWRANFESARSRLLELGYDERFQRLWRLYLCFCEAGFTARRISDVQVLLAKPRWRAALARTPAVAVARAAAD